MAGLRVFRLWGGGLPPFDGPYQCGQGDPNCRNDCRIGQLVAGSISAFFAHGPFNSKVRFGCILGHSPRWSRHWGYMKGHQFVLVALRRFGIGSLDHAAGYENASDYRLRLVRDNPVDICTEQA